MCNRRAFEWHLGSIFQYGLGCDILSKSVRGAGKRLALFRRFQYSLTLVKDRKDDTPLLQGTTFVGWIIIESLQLSCRESTPVASTLSSMTVMALASGILFLKLLVRLPYVLMPYSVKRHTTTRATECNAFSV